jgi:cell division protein FtsB
MSTRRTSSTGRAVIVVCVLAALAVTLAVPIRELLTQRAEIDSLSDEVAAAQVRVDDLTDRVADWQDPAFVAAQARTRLHFVFPGEVGYVVLGADDRPLDPDAIPAEEAAEQPWFAKAWDSVQRADRPDSSGAISDAG